jgi:hypothetical protein
MRAVFSEPVGQTMIARFVPTTPRAEEVQLELMMELALEPVQHRGLSQTVSTVLMAMGPTESRLRVGQWAPYQKYSQMYLRA